MAEKYREDIRRGVESLLNCLICTEEYTNPKVLPCQHTFCLSCLERFYESHNQQRIIRTSNFPCPQCRKTVYMPPNGLGTLPNDFKVGQIQDVMDKIHITIEGKGINCDVCRHEFKRSKSDSFCVQCSKYLCRSCTQNHSTNTLFSSHATITIGNQNAESLICAEHKEEIKYYCEQCRVALCTVCALSKHSKHETQDVSSALDKQRQQIVVHADTLKENLLLYESKAEKLANLKKEREKNVLEIKNDIKKHVKDFLSRVKEEESRLGEELDKTLKYITREADKEIDGINSLVKNIKTVCDSADSILNNGQSMDQINKYDKLIANMQGYIQPPNSNLPGNLSKCIKFAPNVEPRIGEIGYESQQNGGETPADPRTSSPHSESEPRTPRRLPKPKGKQVEKLSNCNGIDVSIPPARVPVQRSQSLREESPYRTSRGSPSRGSPKRGSTPTRMSPLRSSTPINTSPRTSMLATPPGTPPPVGAVGGVAEYTKPVNANDAKIKWKTFENAEARDVAFLADGTVVVTEYKEGSDKLQLFDISGNLKCSVACSSQNLVRPWCCAVNQQTGHLVITDRGDRAVKVLDSDLSIRQVWRSLFEKPSGVAVMRTGEFIITDIATKNYMCSIHSASGIRKREFASRGTSTGQLLTPNYVMADHHDRLVIADSEQHCVKIFDTRGSQLAKITSGDPKSPITPMGLCTDAQNNILVADQAYQGISLYSSDGKFIQHIAKMKDVPWSVALHDQGLLAVATDPSLYMFHMPHLMT